MNITKQNGALIVDANPVRASEVGGIAGTLNFTARIEISPGNVAHRYKGCAVALVGFSRKPVDGSSELNAIHTMHGQALPVMAYGDRISDWAIRARCLPLIAGAAHLLDSSRTEFGVELKEWLHSVDQTIACREKEVSELHQAMQSVGIYAASNVMLDLFRLLLRFSRLSDLPTLITGETGTGKEKFARALHQLDPKRSRGPFVPVNCAALSVTLAESELFGHRRGSFTGAERDKRGLIRAAEGGVLFLDEIGELTEAVQTKLLRVLQEGRVLVVGEEREEEVNVRIVAATNRNLAQCVSEGRFRADLFHRLKVLQLQIPPLRERREDIRALVNHFLQKYSKPFGLSCCLADETLEALEQLKLPGNVRELENIIRGAFVKDEPPATLQLRDLPLDVLSEIVGSAPREVAELSPCDGKTLEAGIRQQFERLIDLTNGRLDHSMDFCERVLISVALGRTDGNQSETARLLRITPRSVYNKLRRHQLQPHSIR